MELQADDPASSLPPVATARVSVDGEASAAPQPPVETVEPTAGAVKERRSARAAGQAVREYPDADVVCGLFEAFVVVGVRGDRASVREPQDAQTLFCWPPEYEHTNAPHLTSAAKFCFGQPLTVRTVPRSLSDSALNLLVHASDQAATRRHVFCFNHSNGSFLWGVCLIKEELLSLPLSFLPPLTSTAAAAEAPTDHRAAERAYCLLSRWPLFSPLFDVLISTLAHERAHRLSVGSDLSPLAELQSVYRSAQLSRGRDCFVNLFSRTISVDVPVAGTDAFFVEALVAQCLPTALHRLSMASLVRLFCAAMLCKQVVVRSRVSGVAAAVVLSLSTLLRPLRWEGLVIPWLPRDMVTALEAPVPYFIGLHADVRVAVASVDGLVVDCDTDRCQVTSVYPLLPASTQLCSNLSPILSRHFPRSGAAAPISAALDPTPEQGTAAVQVSLCFKAYVGWLVSKLETHFAAHAECVDSRSLRDSFLPTVSSGNRAFVSAWMQTQHVSTIVHHWLQERRKPPQQ